MLIADTDFLRRQRHYFAMLPDGSLISLGDFGDFDAANDAADGLELEAWWIFDAKALATFIDTAATLIERIKESP